AIGEPRALLPTVRLAADAIWLPNPPATGEHTPWTPQLLKAVGRLAAAEATACSDSGAPELRAALTTAGFEVELAPDADPRGVATRARWSPRFVAPRLPNPAVSTADALVVGAGLAGAAVAQALAQQGLKVTVFESATAVAQGASGNPGGLFHGTVNADDGPYARLYRAAALAAASIYRRSLSQGGVAGQVKGLLRLAEHADGLGGLQQLLAHTGLPASYVQLLNQEAASALAGVKLSGPCWHYPDAGWLSPSPWVRQALDTPGITLHTGTAVQALSKQGGRWVLHGHGGHELARSPLLVLCNALQAQGLLLPLGAQPWPLSQTRGQVSQFSTAGRPPLHCPVAGDGYALPLPDGILCGATRQADDDDTRVRDEDHRHNLERLQRLTGLGLQVGSQPLQGRVGWRLHSDDRLPVAGALPALAMPVGQRLDQARLLPREAGLFVLTALGARGLTLAPLLGRLVAAQATGTPWPLEQDLADAVDPGRW
ncbi:MAG: FAD-dependent 5-carboxymethylaminomethyl-2-thiouridine(34) oxidoreductase MnmC, partial [Rubrivivax sp.]|nr:FAD-dependent 5-carboxymethylaminomethyl-2-thiouridine(34) oxidoreductase MnmC [Rubrivivax sp.]